MSNYFLNIFRPARPSLPIRDLWTRPVDKTSDIPDDLKMILSKVPNPFSDDFDIVATPITNPTNQDKMISGLADGIINPNSLVVPPTQPLVFVPENGQPPAQLLPASVQVEVAEVPASLSVITDNSNVIDDIVTVDVPEAPLQPALPNPDVTVNMALPQDMPKPGLQGLDETHAAVEVKAVVQEAQATAVATVTTVAELLKNFKSLWGLPFVFFWMLYSSKERFVSNINLSFTATPAKKVYQVTIGKGDAAVSIAFEVQSGQPVRFLREAGAELNDSADDLSLFQPENLVNISRWGPFSAFVWRRKEHYSVFNFFINDPAKDAQKDSEEGPTIPISDKEFIRFLQSNASSASQEGAQPMLDASDEEIDAMRILSLNLDKPPLNVDTRVPHTQRILIPPMLGTVGEPKEYVEITQQELAY